MICVSQLMGCMGFTIAVGVGVALCEQPRATKATARKKKGCNAMAELWEKFLTYHWNA